MDIPNISTNLMIQPDFDIDKDKDIKSEDVAEIEMIAREEKPKLKDDELFDDKDNKEVIQEEQIEKQEEEQIINEPVKEIKKPVKKVHPRKGKKLSKAHREALARGRAKALANRKKKAEIRKKLKKEKKIEKSKAVEYEYEKFQTEKKQKEIERKNILLNEKLDLNSVGKFFDLMDKYERLKTLRKQEYYKEKIKLKAQKYKSVEEKPKNVYKKPITNTPPKTNYKYAHLWGIQ